ncbi:MAG: pyridoxal-phosphate dependent enzyme [Acidimicrobiia bacterium]|nr:pyridoxal-phosphate dependent enzyme [Acidimicrobiia bacterium]
MTVGTRLREDLTRYGIKPTPLLDLSALAPDGVSLYGKAEWHLPTGSIKDRIAASMVARARGDGLIDSDTRLLEPSSGNTGIALGRIAAIEGVPLTVVAPDNVSSERIDLLKAYGVDLVFTPGDEGSNGAVRQAERLAAEGGYLMLHQYENPGNPGAHELTTGPEIVDQVGELGHERIDAFVATLGTGGTVTGVARALKPIMPDVRVVAAAPPSGELIAGLRSLEDGYIPPIFDASLLGGKILVRTADSIRMARRVMAELGWFVGPSAGAAVHASLKVASRLEPGSVVVTVLCDAGWKYLSTGVFSGTVEEATDRVLGTTLW